MTRISKYQYEWDANPQDNRFIPKITIMGLIMALFFFCGRDPAMGFTADQCCLEPKDSIVAVRHLPEMKYPKNVKSFIERWRLIAVLEMRKYKVPASIALAQGMLESQYGESRMVRKGNAYFGIKCTKGYKCGKHSEGYFRYYDTAWESWRDHSVFLQKQRYIHLQKHGNDYKKWAHGLKKAKYAEDPRYAHKLIDLIEKYKLYEYDRL